MGYEKCSNIKSSAPFRQPEHTISVFLGFFLVAVVLFPYVSKGVDGMEWLFGSDSLTVDSNTFPRQRTVQGAKLAATVSRLLVKLFHNRTVLNGTIATKQSPSECGNGGALMVWRLLGLRRKDAMAQLS